MQIIFVYHLIIQHYQLLLNYHTLIMRDIKLSL